MLGSSLVQVPRLSPIFRAKKVQYPFCSTICGARAWARLGWTAILSAVRFTLKSLRDMFFAYTGHVATLAVVFFCSRTRAILFILYSESEFGHVGTGITVTLQPKG